MRFSREFSDDRETLLLRDVAFNRQSFQDGSHNSPYSNGQVSVGTDGIEVRLVQGIDEPAFRRVLARALHATTGRALDEIEDDGSWEELLRGGLQGALESQVVVFEVFGVSRTCTHQLVRSRRASFHQQSQRATFMGSTPDARMPESVWRNDRARFAWIEAKKASDAAYRIACEEDISYQDAREVLLEATQTYIQCEYPVREFLAVYAYRACSMFNWQIVHAVREMGRLLSEAHPWLAPYIKISCQTDGLCDLCEGTGYLTLKDLGSLATEEEKASAVSGRVPCSDCGGGGKLGSRCTFQGWESVEGQCSFPWAKEELRTYRPAAVLQIGKKPKTHAFVTMESYGVNLNPSCHTCGTKLTVAGGDGRHTFSGRLPQPDRESSRD